MYQTSTIKFKYHDPTDWEGGVQIRTLKPTGRWKIDYDDRGKQKLYIEHRGWIFKYWIPEDWIFESHPSPIINDCSKK